MKHWKPEEVEWLKENFEKSKLTQIAKKFNRPEKAVMSKVYSLKILTGHKYNHDEYIIERLSKGFKQVEIQEELGITKRQMESCVHKLKKKNESRTLIQCILKEYGIVK